MDRNTGCGWDNTWKQVMSKVCACVLCFPTWKQTFCVHLLFLVHEVVPERRQNVLYAKSFPNISIVLEQIHIFRTSVVAEFITGQDTQLHAVLTVASPAFKTIPKLPVPSSPHTLPAIRVWLLGTKPGILFILIY